MHLFSKINFNPIVLLVADHQRALTGYFPGKRI